MKSKSKSHGLELDLETLARFRKDVEYSQLLQLSQRFAIYEERRAAGGIPNTFIALEALGALAGAISEGFDTEQIRDCWPTEWGDRTVEVPAVLVATIARAWLDYKNNYDQKSMGQSFKLEAEGSKTRKIVTSSNKSDKDLRLTNAVELEYWGALNDEHPISYETAIELVAKSHGASEEVVRKAHLRTKRTVRNHLIKMGILRRASGKASSST